MTDVGEQSLQAGAVHRTTREAAVIVWLIDQPPAFVCLEAVEFATLEWMDWFNHRRLLGPIGGIPPAEVEARYYAQAEAVAMAA